MTNEEARDILINYLSPPIIRNDGKSMAHLKAFEAINVAVTALEALPTAETDTYKEFALWVAGSIFEENFDDNVGVFAEVACRKLEKLGLVKKVEGNWRYVGDRCVARMENDSSSIIFTKR